MTRKRVNHERKEQIIWALFECLAVSGHEKVTVKDIATQAGLTPGVIHYYFKSKDDIVTQLARSIIEKYAGHLEARLAGIQSDRQRMTVLVDFIVDQLIFDLRLNRVFYNLIQMAFERESLSDVLVAFFRAYRQHGGQAFPSSDHDGNARRMGILLVTLAEGFALQVTVDPQALDREEVRTWVGIILERLLPGAPSASPAE